MKNKTAIFFLFLLAAGFEFTILELSMKDVTYTAYMVGIFASSLLLLYCIPLLFGVNILVKKLQGSWKVFLGSFVSGFFIATFLSIYGNSLLENAWSAVFSEDIMEQWGDALSAPFAEEFIKAFICVLLLYIIKEMKIKHFLIAGIGVGMGFQLLEDITYIIPDSMSDGVIDEIIPGALERISIFVDSHWMYTALVAVGIYMVYKRRKQLKGYVYILAPVVAHFIWNSPMIDGDASISVLSAAMTTVVVLLFVSSIKEVFLQEELPLCYNNSKKYIVSQQSLARKGKERQKDSMQKGSAGMISDKMAALVAGSSAIRAMFEDGKILAEEFGAENVYDFSLGNPNVSAPEAVKKAIVDVLNEERPAFVHGYMNNSGYEDVRRAVAENINGKFQTDFSEENILMTVGAAGGLNVILKVLLNPGDEVVAFAPFFGEYTNYVANYDGKLVVVPPNAPTFQPNLKEFEKRLTARTKAVIVNSPNNPTGVVYTEDTIGRMAEILEEKQKEFKTDIYILCDEPYRELAYDGVSVPYVPKYYRNTIVGYSYSKSLSLPGERIGYLVMPSQISDFDNVIQAANVANRILGFVNAPSLIQRAVARCLDAEVDVAYYNRNRETLYEGLIELGLECTKPEGAFYLFVKSPIADDKAFCAMAKKFRLLVVPGASFGAPGYVRIAYCVAYETIVSSMSQFKALMEEVKSM